MWFFYIFHLKAKLQRKTKIDEISRTKDKIKMTNKESKIIIILNIVAINSNLKTLNHIIHSINMSIQCLCVFLCVCVSI